MFQPPVPLKSWNGVYNATGDNINSKVVCPQPFPEEIGSESDEDCLFLNVYTKAVCAYLNFVMFHGCDSFFFFFFNVV